MSAVWWFDDEPDKGELWTAHEAERLLGVKQSTIRSWVRRKKLTPAERNDRYGRHQFWENDLRALVVNPRRCT